MELTEAVQMIPPQLKYTVEGATPSFTDGVDQTVERGSQVRLRIKGIRGEMGQMFAIGSIREDYLGYAHRLHTKAGNIRTADHMHRPLLQ